MPTTDIVDKDEALGTNYPAGHPLEAGTMVLLSDSMYLHNITEVGRLLSWYQMSSPNWNPHMPGNIMYKVELHDGDIHDYVHYCVFAVNNKRIGLLTKSITKALVRVNYRQLKLECALKALEDKVLVVLPEPPKGLYKR